MPATEIRLQTRNGRFAGLAEWISRDRVKRRLQAVPDCRHHRIEGRHHFHMEQPQRTAQFILDFLASPEQTDDRHPPDHSEP